VEIVYDGRKKDHRPDIGQIPPEGSRFYRHCGDDRNRNNLWRLLETTKDASRQAWSFRTC
jgi:hypothetical protein